MLEQLETNTSTEENLTEQTVTDQRALRATCPNCGSTEYFCVRSKDRNYSFVLGISNPEDVTGKIIPYLPVRVITCGICNRITLEVETYE